MNNTAFFPTSAETLPIAMYINQYSTKYHITTFLAFPGSGLCGKDIGRADNRGDIGIIVQDCFSGLPNDCTHLIVANLSEFSTNETLLFTHVMTVIENALTAGKVVICSAKLNDQALAQLSYHPCFHNFTYLHDKVDELLYANSNQLYKPSPYVVFFGTSFYETSTLSPFLSLHQELSKQYNVFSFSTSMNSVICDIPSIHSILYEQSLSEEEKVYAINSFLRLRTEEGMPDIIMVHISEPIMAYNDKITNGFGIIPFLISKALQPDYFICGIPVTHAFTNYIRAFSSGVLNQFGFAIDYIHIANVIIDPAVSLSQKNITAFTTFDDTDRQKDMFCFDSEIPVDNLLIHSNLHDISTIISSALCDQYRFKLLI